jgi:hypothetical protein
MTNRWMIAAAFALALGACKTTSERETAEAERDRAEEAAVARADDERREAQKDPQDEAAEQAPSTRPQSGVGTQDPHPMTEKDAKGEETFSGNAPQQQGAEGRVPPSREPGEQDAQATATGMPEASGTAPESTTAAATPSQVAGRVALVDEQNREIAIDSGDSTTQVKIAEDAQILINGERAELGDVKQGAEVRASLEQLGDQPQATRVEVTSKSKSRE